ncbi:MAG TPA: patatin-like phospholipase family protein [Dehalococcoidales bacterium]|nr:patatin-like phospholipase family protein [Dehalococcoidales bacterium]
MPASGLKVGLALGGGSARGLAHIGVLEVLEREGIPIDLIAGTSAGALVGALYARNKDAAQIKKQAMALDWVAFTSLVDLTLPKNGFVSGKRVTSLLKRFMGEADFKDLAIPLSCTATDIISGDEVIMNSGSVLEAVRASISIPVIFAVAKYQNRFLVDGGLVNPVPVKTVKDMGADFVIAVDVTPGKAEREAFLRTHAEVKEPNLFQVIVQTIYVATYYSAHVASEGADVVIHPRLAHISPGEFHRASELILEGSLAAVDSIAKIRRRLEEAGIPLKNTRKFVPSQ